MSSPAAKASRGARLPGSLRLALGRSGATTSRGPSGEDLTKDPNDVFNWNGAGYTRGTTAWIRFCSADMPTPDALRYGFKGTSERIFLGGEENGMEGRAWARIVTGPYAGQAWQLPRLGKLAFENVIASPGSRDKTVVACPDDGPGGQVYIYVGDKQGMATRSSRPASPTASSTGSRSRSAAQP